MKEQRIGILALQETKLDDEHLEEIESRCRKTLRIFNSKLTENPSASAGVAFALNKETIKTDEASVIPLIEGRALLLKIKWNESENLTILNIYAPNSAAAHPPFWSKVERRLLEEQITHLDYMLGDFNLVEDARDRSPPHPDDENAVAALREFRQNFGLIDAWRRDNEKEREFTYRHNTNHSKSRLDRIYTSEEHAKTAHDWETRTKALPSDHDMVSVRHALKSAPHIGHGRWTWPIFLATDPTLLTTVSKLGQNLEKELDQLTGDRQETNPQVLWQDFKAQITAEAKKTAKKATPEKSQTHQT
ncbi:DNase I-like protein [Auriscalpium vulgare]|uniref:DNase I-like protein n=1 Tax=Auriscalpium vulgare TaxID=40419 RepID=A0ACB8R1V9_9AGAM|nr:DNase I-like protein [Auriscalpium vulgare]